MPLISIPVLVMAGITLYVGLYYLLVWLPIRKDIGYFYFFGLCASMAAYDVFSALLYNSRHFEASIWCQRGQFASIAGIACWTFLFAARYLRQKLSAWLRLLFGLYAAFVFLSWIDSPLFLHLSRRAPKTVALGSFTVRYLEVQPGPMLNVFYLLLFIGILTSYVYFVDTYRKHRELRSAFLQGGFTVFFLATLSDMLIGAGVVKFVYTLEYSFLALILVMDFLIRRDYLALADKEKMHALELEASIAKIKTLRGLVPICPGCKKIRNDEGYWQQVEVYVSEHSEADFSHCLCPQCAKRLYPGYFREEETHAGEGRDKPGNRS
jgi:hypothetical protein